jgi:hypothetical protein
LEVFAAGMAAHPIHTYIKENGETDPYLVDGFLLDQIVTSYYTHVNRLNRAYLQSNFFTPTIIEKFYSVNDSQILSIKLQSTASMLIRNVAGILHANESVDGSTLLKFDLGRSNEIIKKQYPEIVKFLDVLGYEEMADCDFNKAVIKKKVQVKEKELERKSPKLIAKIQSLYKPEETPMELEIVAQFQVIYNDLGICETARASHIQRYYIASRTSNDQNLKAWKIKGRKTM